MPSDFVDSISIPVLTIRSLKCQEKTPSIAQGPRPFLPQMQNITTQEMDLSSRFGSMYLKNFVDLSVLKKALVYVGGQ